MSSDFVKAVERVCEVVMFENWLRFYFIQEGDNDALLIHIPDKSFEMLRTSYPTLVGLAEQLNGKEINHELSIQSVCMFVAAEVDGVVVPEQVMNRVFDSKDFQVVMQLFSTWVQTHEDQLDSNFMEFARWKALFAEWVATDNVREYKKELESHIVHTATETTGTMQ